MVYVIDNELYFHQWPHGPMVKALDYDSYLKSRDSRFDSWCGRYFFLFLICFKAIARLKFVTGIEPRY